MNTNVFAICILAISATAFAGSSEDLEMKVMANAITCQMSTGVKHDEIFAMQNLRVPEDKKAQCFLACMAKSMDIMSNDNKLNTGNIASMAAPFKSKIDEADPEYYAKGEKVMNKCNEELTGGGDECEEAKKAMECAVKYGKEEGLISTE